MALVIVQVLELELRLGYQRVQLVLLGLQVSQVSVEISMLSRQAMVPGSTPVHSVLAFLLHQPNTFQYVGNVINPSLLNPQAFTSLVQVQGTTGV